MHFNHIASNLPISLKEKSIQEEQEISNRLYKDFKAFRATLFENIVKNNPNLDKTELLSATSKLCDRFVFIAFAEDKGLLPAQTIANLIASHQSSHKGFSTKEPLYNYYKNLFNAIDKGDAKNNIGKFNGGLFCDDEFLNSLVIDDFALDLTPICKYDFVSDVSVYILGHIFEQSLNDLEEINALITGEKLEKSATKRKKDGIFYTPEFITRYIVNETLGKICDDKKQELNIVNIAEPKTPTNLKKNEKTDLENLKAYKAFLLSLKILDPACGSGAFLNQALEFLIKEHKWLSVQFAKFQDLFANEYTSERILEQNLYGIDINADAVEIAKLSLWLIEQP